MIRAFVMLGLVTAIVAPTRAFAASRDDCASIVIVPDSEDVAAWNELMTLAACLQDDRVGTVSQPDDLEPLVAELAAGLTPTVILYLEALEHGPLSIQLRAAYQIGAANIALIVRARASLVTADPVLHAQLEPLLAHARETSWIAFAAVVRAAESDPAFAPDDVTRTMVRSARAFLASSSLENAPPSLRMARDGRPFRRLTR